jgi:hypothetical protein
LYHQVVASFLKISCLYLLILRECAITLPHGLCIPKNNSKKKKHPSGFVCNKSRWWQTVIFHAQCLTGGNIWIYVNFSISQLLSRKVKIRLILLQATRNFYGLKETELADKKSSDIIYGMQILFHKESKSKKQPSILTNVFFQNTIKKCSCENRLSPFDSKFPKQTAQCVAGPS